MKTLTQSVKPTISQSRKAGDQETAQERKEYFDYLFAKVGAAMSSELRILDEDGTYTDINAGREEQVFADAARRAHLYTWHLMQVRDFADFDETIASCNSDE
jgi:hypothetical protein